MQRRRNKERIKQNELAEEWGLKLGDIIYIYVVVAEVVKAGRRLVVCPIAPNFGPFLIFISLKSVL